MRGVAVCFPMSALHRKLGLAVLASLLACSHVAIVCADAVTERYAAALAQRLEQNERDTLEKIPAHDRRLLALRSYLRAGKNLRERWSWTDAQIRDYEQSAEYRQLLADIAAIVKEFEARNPGYTLYANTQVRSLDVQIERWNSNPRVGATAKNLERGAQIAVAKLPRQPTDALLTQFERFLKAWPPSPTSPLAAPGLSLHGQSRAIDFQIMQGGRIVAATEVGAVARQWDAPGWTRRLKEAVEAGSQRFEGPLRAPNEPWHYEYK
jgi:hypothetical protein